MNKKGTATVRRCSTLLIVAILVSSCDSSPRTATQHTPRSVPGRILALADDTVPTAAQSENVGVESSMLASQEQWNALTGAPPDAPPIGEVLSAAAAGVLARHTPNLRPGPRGSSADVWVLLGEARAPQRVVQTAHGVTPVTFEQAGTALSVPISRIAQMTVTGTNGTYGQRVRMIWISER